MRFRTLFERFSSSYTIDNQTGCWVWVKYKNPKGYGRIMLYDKPWLASRVSYFLYIGHLPNHLYVCHTCDNPACVNPAHLFLGTHKDNCNDRDAKGRVAKGENAGKSKLDNIQVLTIRSCFNSGLKTNDIAKYFKMSKSSIFYVTRNISWQHLITH